LKKREIRQEDTRSQANILEGCTTGFSLPVCEPGRRFVSQNYSFPSIFHSAFQITISFYDQAVNKHNAAIESDARRK